jgi:hypothetical protein
MMDCTWVTTCGTSPCTPHYHSGENRKRGRKNERNVQDKGEKRKDEEKY